ncbi:MAG: nicotinate-nucleotide--dimethylbenzimidazole phosphoribosyltransferase [Clostridia bacterium]|nr:nicotinate-nucleotide--dimethylbenzimidazole phosphoribosyltransferase [Clostridia bacterium]
MELAQRRLDFAELNASIAPRDAAAGAQVMRRWNDIAKPVGSLGALEQMVASIAELTGNPDVRADRRIVVVMCADNGVLAEGVASTPQDITAVMAGFIAAGKSCVCIMAGAANADVLPVDVGMARRAYGVRDEHIADGTGNIAAGAAMSREQAERAIALGMELAAECKARGYDIIATGEMGIGNTTTSSAVAAVLLGESAERVTGRGAGIDDAMLQRKVDVVKRAIEVNAPDAGDALDVLSKLGGYDIAAMAGLYIGGAIHRVPVLIDGIISSVAALVASRLCPACKVAMLASHRSAEPASGAILRALGLNALIDAQLRLGEGTGAVCALPLLDMALAVYRNMSTYGDIGAKAFIAPGEE